MRIDVHTHLVYLDFIQHLHGRSSLPNAVKNGGTYVVSCSPGFRAERPPHHFDVEVKLKDMEEMGVELSVLSHGIPGPELLEPAAADDWAARINDHLAGVVERYPDKFIAWGSIGFGSPERSITEVDRCIHQLGFKGIQLFSNIRQTALDSAEFVPVYKHIANLGVPMNMHPTAPLNLVGMDKPSMVADMGFIYDTSLATARMIIAGVFDAVPDLQLIVPHIGGILPYLSGRLERMIGVASEGPHRLAHPPSYYLEKLYVDTVAHSVEALKYCFHMLGAERLLYGTDHPFENYIEVAGMVEELECSEADRQLIYHGNAERLLGL